jgi:hypothetical protein
MVCTWYNKLLWLLVLNKSPTGDAFVRNADKWRVAKPCGLYAADF